MRFSVMIPAVAAGTMATGAVAHSAGEVFQCDLPYQASMEALAGLEVTGQQEASGFMRLALGPHTIITFAPGDTVIFNSTPQALSVTLFEPDADDPEKTIKVNFQSSFANNAENDRKIMSANDWHFDVCDGLFTCIRAEDRAKPAMLEYKRGDPDRPLHVICRFEIREDELGN